MASQIVAEKLPRQTISIYYIGTGPGGKDEEFFVTRTVTLTDYEAAPLDDNTWDHVFTGTVRYDRGCFSVTTDIRTWQADLPSNLFEPGNMTWLLGDEIFE